MKEVLGSASRGKEGFFYIRGGDRGRLKSGGLEDQPEIYRDERGIRKTHSTG